MLLRWSKCRCINRPTQCLPNSPPCISSAMFLTIAGVGGVPLVTKRPIWPSRTFSCRNSVVASVVCDVCLHHNLEHPADPNQQSPPKSVRCGPYYRLRIERERERFIFRQLSPVVAIWRLPQVQRFYLCAELECIKWGASRDQIRYPLSGYNDVTMQVGDLILVSGRLLVIIFCD